MLTHPDFCPVAIQIMRTDGNAYALADGPKERKYLMVAPLNVDGTIDEDQWTEFDPQNDVERGFMFATMQALKQIAKMHEPVPVPQIVPRVTVIKTRTMHHDNLELRLNHDTYFNIYTISVWRENERSEHDLWGMWELCDRAIAEAKFDLIQL